jgi:predicted RND superfamily exporter protein
MYGAVLARSLGEVQDKIKALKSYPSVSEIQSVLSLLPEEQEEKMRVLNGLKPLVPETVAPFSDGPVDLSGLQKTLGRIRFKMLDSNKEEWGKRTPLEAQMLQVRDLIESIRTRYSSTDQTALPQVLKGFERVLMHDLTDKLATLHANAHNPFPMQVPDLPQSLLKRFVGRDNLYLIRVYPHYDIWEPTLLGKFVHDLRAVDPDVIGDPVTLYTFTVAFRDACIKAAIYAVIFVSVLLLCTFRNVFHALLAILPLFVGTAWTLGWMRCLGVNLNLANSLFLPMVVGAGVEYAIIVLQRWKQREPGAPIIPISTGKGIILAGLTTTVGFGSLLISDHRGIYSLGLLATIGSLCILIAAVFVLPAVLHVLSTFFAGSTYRDFAFSAGQNLDKCASSKKERV